MTRAWPLVALAVSVVAGVVNGLALAGDHEPTRMTATGVRCGVERWTVKTLKDRPVLTGPVPTTIAALDAIPAPTLPTDNTTRLAGEHEIEIVRGTVTYIAHEADSDTHVALTDGQGHTMISEYPDGSCTIGADTKLRIYMGMARSWLLQNVKVGDAVVVKGVRFFDFQHGQHGVAPNAVELHPVLAVWKPTGRAS